MTRKSGAPVERQEILRRLRLLRMTNKGQASLNDISPLCHSERQRGISALGPFEILRLTL